jgi:hypothetical protein
MPSRAELEAEVIRLREQLAMAEANQGPSANDMGVAGRVAITRLRDTDLPELVSAVDQIPDIYERFGYVRALAYCQVHIRGLVDAMSLIAPKTGNLVQTQHRIHMMLNEGEADLMMRKDQAGLRARMEFLVVVERYVYSLAVRAAFAHGAETPAGIIPPTFGGGGQEG